MAKSNSMQDLSFLTISFLSVLLRLVTSWRGKALHVSGNCLQNDYLGYQSYQIVKGKPNIFILLRYILDLFLRSRLRLMMIFYQFIIEFKYSFS